MYLYILDYKPPLLRMEKKTLEKKSFLVYEYDIYQETSAKFQLG